MMTDKLMISRIIERELQWDKWRNEIPFIAFKEDWEVRIIPPFAAAIIRFVVRKKGDSYKTISIYLDCYDVLGCFGEPYWEIYPHINDECFRCPMNDISALLKAIDESLNDNEGNT